MTGKARVPSPRRSRWRRLLPMLAGCFAEPSAPRRCATSWSAGRAATTPRPPSAPRGPKAVRKALEDAKLQLDAASFRFNLTGDPGHGGEGDGRVQGRGRPGGEQPAVGATAARCAAPVGRKWKVAGARVIHPQLGQGQRLRGGCRPRRGASRSWTARRPAPGAGHPVRGGRDARPARRTRERSAAGSPRSPDLPQDRLLEPDPLRAARTSRCRSSPSAAPSSPSSATSSGHPRRHDRRPQAQSLAPDVAHADRRQLGPVTPERLQQVGGP